MKLKNIFGIALSALLFAACADDDPVGSFTDIRVDKNFVTLQTSESSVTVKVTASGEWQLENLYSVDATIDGQKKKLYYPVPVTLNKEKTAGVPTWLTVDKTSGAAGESVITLSAGKTEAGRETEICINMGGLKQFIKVRQGELTASAAKCSEIMKGTDGKNYRVTGRVTKITGYDYGNWYLDDGTFDFASTEKNQDGLYIYGTLDKNGKSGKVNPIDGADGWGFEVGDVVTVEGPLSIYNGVTYELINVTVIKIVKSLIQVISAEPNIETEGGSFDVKVAYKGNGAFFEFSDEAQSWISYEGVSYKAGTKTIFEQNPADTAIFKFTAAPNALAKRSAVIKFSSNSGSNSSVINYTVNQKGVAFPPAGSGTEDDPFNVTAAINACANGMTGAYVKGIVSQAPTSVNTKYGSCTYFISADGKESSDQLQIYSGLFLQNEKFTSSDQVKVGDEVIVVGDLKLYNGTPEMDKNNWIYSLNGNKGGGVSLPTSLDVDFMTNGQGDWTIKEATALPEGVSYIWSHDAKYGMKATSYINKVRYVVDSWLISPAVALDKEATLTFEQALNYGDNTTVHVMYSTTYDGGAINAAEWKELTLDQWPAGNNWNFLTSTAKVPAATKVCVAFRYTSTADIATTWEIKTLSLK